MMPTGEEPCPFCGVPTATLYAGRDPRFPKPELYRVQWCGPCGIGSTFPRPSQGDFALHYPDDYDPYKPEPLRTARSRARRWALQAERRIGLAALDGIPPGRLLDVGCGNGAFLEAMTRRGFDATGVEISPRASDLAHARGLRVVTGDFLRVPLPEEAFDLVTMNHYLEHSPDPRASLERARESLAPGGLLVVGVPDFGSWVRRAFGADWADLELPRHLSHFSRRGLARMLASCGFLLEAIRPDPTADGNSILTSLLVRAGKRDDARVGRAYPGLHILAYPASVPLAMVHGSAWIRAFARKAATPRA